MARKSLIPAGSYLPADEDDGPRDAGMLERIVQRDAVKHGRRAEAADIPAPAQSYDKSYENMTSHTESQEESKPEDNTGRQKDRQQQGPSSVRAAIQATLQKAGQAGEVLKTVTIKLAPSLDRRVEEHCFQTGRKKQEVVRDALLLYFEAIEEAAEGDQD